MGYWKKLHPKSFPPKNNHHEKSSLTSSLNFLSSMQDTRMPNPLLEWKKVEKLFKFKYEVLKQISSLDFASTYQRVFHAVWFKFRNAIPHRKGENLQDGKYNVPLGQVVYPTTTYDGDRTRIVWRHWKMDISIWCKLTYYCETSSEKRVPSAKKPEHE